MLYSEIVTQWDAERRVHLRTHLQRADVAEAIGEARWGGAVLSQKPETLPIVTGVDAEGEPLEFYAVLDGYMVKATTTFDVFQGTHYIRGGKVYKAPDIASPVLKVVPVPIDYWQVAEGYVRKDHTYAHRPKTGGVFVEAHMYEADVFSAPDPSAAVVGVMWPSEGCDDITGQPSGNIMPDPNVTVWSRPATLDAVEACPQCVVLYTEEIVRNDS